MKEKTPAPEETLKKAFRDGMLTVARICHNQTNNACGADFASQFDCEVAIIEAASKLERQPKD